MGDVEGDRCTGSDESDGLLMPLGPRQEIWVMALESGAFEQAKGRLKDGDAGYCCLGVACDISNLGHWDGSDYTIRDESIHDMNLPDEVRDYFGFRTEDAEIDMVTDGENSLVAMNDADGNPHSFKDIAQFVRAHPDAIFDAVL